MEATGILNRASILQQTCCSFLPQCLWVAIFSCILVPLGQIKATLTIAEGKEKAFTSKLYIFSSLKVCNFTGNTLGLILLWNHCSISPSSGSGAYNSQNSPWGRQGWSWADSWARILAQGAEHWDREGFCSRVPSAFTAPLCQAPA